MTMLPITSLQARVSALTQTTIRDRPEEISGRRRRTTGPRHVTMRATHGSRVCQSTSRSDIASPTKTLAALNKATKYVAAVEFARRQEERNAVNQAVVREGRVVYVSRAALFWQKA